jgi:hypothetical protein
MKKLLFAVFMVCLALPLPAKDAKKEEKKEEGGATKKITLMNFGKGDQLSTMYGEQALAEEHLVGKEKVRMKVMPKKEKIDYNGSCGMFGMAKNCDWSPYNYVVFNCFVEGDKPWKGTFMVGDMDSYKKWGNNYTSVDFTMKPGENKEVHIGIEGLFCASRNAAIDMKNIQVWELFPYDNPPPVIYLANIYLVHEED